MASINCYQYEGGPHHRILKPRPVARPKQIPCPGGCGGQASLEPSMTLTRNGVTTVVTPATCEGSCTMEVTRGRRKPVTVTVPRRFELDPREQPETRKDDDMDEKRQQEIQRLRRCLRHSGLTQQKLADELGISRSTINNFLCKGYATGENHGKLMAWCDEEMGSYDVPVKRREESSDPEPTPEAAIITTPKPVAIPHDSPQEPLQRRARPVETGNAFRAFLEPMLVELVRERLAAINQELAEQVEIRVLLEMPA